MEWLNTREAAVLVGVRPRTLERWRFAGRGPAYTRIGGRSVRYRRDAVERWLREQTVVTP